MSEEIIFRVLALTLVFVVTFGQSYFLFFHPKIWFEWYFRKPSRSVGVRCEVENELKFTRVTRVLGAALIVAGMWFSWLILSIPLVTK